jgi:hypothetical protein
VENLGPSETLSALFDDEQFCSAPDQLVTPTSLDRLSVVRANQTLARHNVPAPEQFGMKQFVLREFLQSQSDFDVALIDCPPNLYQCSWNAMLAADHVVIPVATRSTIAWESRSRCAAQTGRRGEVKPAPDAGRHVGWSVARGSVTGSPGAGRGRLPGVTSAAPPGLAPGALRSRPGVRRAGG